MSPTRDRLNEMRQIQNGGRFESQNSDECNLGTIDKTFEKAEIIRENIEVIKTNTSKANDILKNNVFKLTKRLEDELDSLFGISTKAAYKISSQLKEFDHNLNKLNNTNSAEYRIKAVQYTTLKQDFQDALKASSNSLEYHKNKRKELLKKSLKTTRHSINEEELDALLDENKLDVFTDNILVTTNEARQQLQEIEERHQELLKIEKHLNEVLDLFIKVATLVEQQQESVNRVEYHAATATDFIEHGTSELEKGHKKGKKYRKRKLYCIIIGILVLVSCILILVLI